MNQYEKMKLDFKERLNNAQCRACKGTGKRDNAEPYGMYYDEWLCHNCQGSGLKSQEKQNANR